MTNRQEIEYKLEEVGGDRYPSLKAAQAAALKPVAQALAIAIREMLANGELVVSDGKVVFPGTEDGTSAHGLPTHPSRLTQRHE